MRTNVNLAGLLKAVNKRVAHIQRLLSLMCSFLKAVNERVAHVRTHVNTRIYSAYTPHMRVYLLLLEAVNDRVALACNPHPYLEHNNKRRRREHINDRVALACNPQPHLKHIRNTL